MCYETHPRKVKWEITEAQMVSHHSATVGTMWKTSYTTSKHIQKNVFYPVLVSVLALCPIAAERKNKLGGI